MNKTLIHYYKVLNVNTNTLTAEKIFDGIKSKMLQYWSERD